MKYLKHASNVTAPKLVYEVQLDHSQDPLAARMADDAWRSLITLGDSIAISEWQKFAASGFKNAAPGFDQIVCESQQRTNSCEVYYSAAVSNKAVTLKFFVA